MWSRPQYTDLTYMGGTGPCGPVTIIFGSVIQSQYTSLNIKFGVNRTFHVLKAPKTYMGGTRSCGPIQIIFNNNQRMGNRSLCANFQVCSSLCSDAIVFTTDGYTDGRTDGRRDRHSSNVLEFCADQMSPRNIGSQIIISRCYKKTSRPFNNYTKNINIIRTKISNTKTQYSKSSPVQLIYIWNFVKKCFTYQ